MNVGGACGDNESNGDKGRDRNDDRKFKPTGKHGYRNHKFTLQEIKKMLGMIVYIKARKVDGDKIQVVGDLQEENIPRTSEELDDTDDEWEVKKEAGETAGR